MDNKEKLKLIKILIAIYIASFLIINWNDVSWVFNYQAMSGLVSDFFNPYPTTDASFMVNFYPNHSQDTFVAQEEDQVIQDQVITPTTPTPAPVKEVVVKYTYTDNENTIEIPKIKITAPIIFSQSTEKQSMLKDLDKGVVYYPGSVYPGQVGQIVILGHSAPPNWPHIKHDWVFSELNSLSVGDIINIDINHKRYVYKVKQKTIIQKGQDTSSIVTIKDGNSLMLVSCWPPGKNYLRIAVEAELVSQ